MLFASGSYSQSIGYKVIVTTPGYTSIYRYDPGEVAEAIQRDFRLDTAAVETEQVSADFMKVKLCLGRHVYHFDVRPGSQILRLKYDRNKRQFTALGYNFVDKEGVRCTAPTFKGTSVVKLPALWLNDIDKKIEDRNLLEENGLNRFILEVDIDENGIVHKIEEIGGALKQYSQVFIDKVYDAAVRGWEPAKRNGVPVRTVCHLVFDIDK